MADIYLSYSRKDRDFVEQLITVLEQKNHTVWVDWKHTTPAGDFWSEMCTAIEASDALIHVISPDSAASEYCRNELIHAVAHNKRIVPLLYRDTTRLELDKSHPVILTHRWINFRVEDDAEQGTVDLQTALEADFEYLRQHKHLLLRAQEWTQQGLNRDFLLRGVLLREALEWMQSPAAQTHPPTELQKTFITQSLQAAQSPLARLQKTIVTMPQVLGFGQRKIFISYRRSDSQNITDRIYDRLLRHFRREDIFLDIASIDLGVSFADVIRRNMSECAVALVVIGQTWVNVTEHGSDQRRLDNPEDFVRLEVEIATSNPDVRVMPLLVDGVGMPQADNLPPSLQRLVQMNGTVIRPGRDFHNDMDYVVKQVKKARRAVPV